MLRTITGPAVADFRDRVRRPAYVVILAAAVALGYVAVPDSDAKWMIMQVGDHRGVYNSAYVGMVTALASGLWIMLGGFYIVRNSVERDRSTRVGQLVAATPLRTTAYMAGKFLSNLMLLSSMLGVLAITALVMQLARGESYDVDLYALWQPFFLVALPLAALTAACALLFETLPVLRTGFGNIVWFCVWLVIATVGQGPGQLLGGTGVYEVARSMYDDMVAQKIDMTGSFSLGLTYLDKPLGTFTWDGFTPTATYLLGRIALLLLAVAVAVLPALWFGRFDPARTWQRRERTAQPESAAGAFQPVFIDEVAGQSPPSTRPAAVLRTRPEPGGVTARIWAGEIRILLKGVPWWWWLGAAFLVLLGITAPLHGTSRVMLPLAWIWPIIIWSRLGTQRHEYAVETVLGAYPAVRRRMFAEWGAGLTITAVAGIGPLIRMIIESETTGIASWIGGVLFIPSLALALGTLSRTHRLFQAVYLPLWYTVANGLPVFDYMGALRDSSELAAAQPPVTMAVAAVLLAIVFVAGTLRRYSRD
ncbi:hypothetical protein ACFYWU_30430 [Streptomyces chrestomyceticus]|uniref:hypothetical protein n=1 Tax=Streptomyces chrestomyceticus TaxID=68185 RepID=UPI0019D21618|nr:hypothetical protein [Streptomyces chrestomyceticus]